MTYEHVRQTSLNSIPNAELMEGKRPEDAGDGTDKVKLQ